MTSGTQWHQRCPQGSGGCASQLLPLGHDAADGRVWDVQDGGNLPQHFVAQLHCLSIILCYGHPQEKQKYLAQTTK